MKMRQICGIVMWGGGHTGRDRPPPLERIIEEKTIVANLTEAPALLTNILAWLGNHPMAPIEAIAQGVQAPHIGGHLEHLLGMGCVARRGITYTITPDGRQWLAEFGELVNCAGSRWRDYG